MKLLLVGLGYVGGALGLRLRRHEVIGLRRRVELGGPEGVLVMGGDAATGEGLDQVPRHVEQICIALSPQGRTDEAYRKAYPDSARQLVTHFPGARMLLVSSTSVYGQEGGAQLDDASPTDPKTTTAERIVQAEQVILEANSRSCAVRSSGIYGPGRTRLASQLAHAPLADLPDDLHTNRIHRDDLVGVLEFLLERPDVGGTFVASDLHPATPREMGEWLQMRGAAEILGPPDGLPNTRERRSRKMRPRRLIELGYQFRFPSFREGYADLLDALNQ
jgi:nucleoside-diphosphate-sugar epimerase